MYTLREKSLRAPSLKHAKEKTVQAHKKVSDMNE